ncbi:hypothetical protein LCGC14_0968380 [marine sediment metagenome]|uniref:Major tropism determinant N-terminal domain-containing protein n=1 Tax=marine sediment metagenome TaxID=412755 RepID=A0A0F9RIU8_9ZZZZ
MNNKLVFLLVLALFFSSSVFGASIIQIRRDTAANWTGANPILAQGEMGFEIDSFKLKFGDGTTNWNSLAYYSTATDVNGADILPSSVSVDRNLSVRGDANFLNAQASYFFGDGSGLTNIVSTPDVNGEDINPSAVNIDRNLSVIGDTNLANVSVSGNSFLQALFATTFDATGDANFVNLEANAIFGGTFYGVLSGLLPDSTLDDNSTANTSWLGTAHTFTATQTFQGDLNITESGTDNRVSIEPDLNRIWFGNEMYIDYNGTAMILGG